VLPEDLSGATDLTLPLGNARTNKFFEADLIVMQALTASNEL
jgi:hypothetical protein